jgi:DNA-binding HxlR family transcriptional regulator
MRELKEDLFVGTGSRMVFMQAKNEVKILDALEENPKSIQQIAREIGLSSPTVCKLLRELLSDDLVEREIAEGRGTTLIYKLKEI